MKPDNSRLQEAIEYMWNQKAEDKFWNIARVARVFQVDANQLHKIMLDRIEAELRARIAAKSEKKDAV